MEMERDTDVVRLCLCWRERERERVFYVYVCLCSVASGLTWRCGGVMCVSTRVWEVRSESARCELCTALGANLRSLMRDARAETRAFQDKDLVTIETTL